jgi:phosphotransferase system HPr (HPr) family protein
VPESSERTATLPADVALHARPAADFVRAAMGYESAIVVSKGDRDADAKSLLGILALGATGGTEIGLRAEGADAAAAVEGLAALVEGLVE